MYSISRWLIVIVGSIMNVSAGPQISFEGLPNSGVVLYAGATSEFNQILDARIEPATRSAIAPLLPYSVILVNRSASPLVAVVVRAELTDQFGKTITSDMMISSLTLHNMIPVGATILVTPVSGLNTVLREGRQMSLDAADDLAQMVARRSSRYSAQTGIRITLDSVAFSDGSVVGPDLTNNLSRMNSWIEAERALAEELLRCDPAEVPAFLEDAIRRTTELPLSAVKNVYQFADHRRHAARMALLLSQHLGTGAEFAAEVSGRIGSLVPMLHRRDGK